MPIIECGGRYECVRHSKAAPNIVAMAIGLGDYTADLGVKRTLEGKESLFARSTLVNACRCPHPTD